MQKVSCARVTRARVALCVRVPYPLTASVHCVRFWRAVFFSFPQMEDRFMRRRKMSRRKSRKAFRRGAGRQHSRNRMMGPGMRGGIRL